MFKLPWQKSCPHDKITPNMSAGYCPDCGEYVQNKWFITRCSCCNIKQKTSVKNGKVITEAKFCRNCGSHSFIIEELNSLDIVNINYAVVLKQVLEIKRQSFIQTWIEENTFTPIKLLPSY